MYFLLRQLSYVRFLFPLVVGIILGIYFPTDIHDYLLAIICFVSLLVSLIGIVYFKISKNSFVSGIIISITIMIFGFSITEINKLKFHTNYFEKISNKNDFLIVQIAEPPQEKEKSFKALANIEAVYQNGINKNSCGKLQLYFNKKGASIAYGDVVIIPIHKLNIIANPKNPYEFDYKQFMSFKQVHYQAFLNASDYKILAKEKGDLLLTKIYKLRSHLNATLKRFIENEQSYQIASSLLLGTRETLDFQLIRAYSSSGAMHVLAVSGLHVAILFVILEKLLFFLNKNSKTQKIQAAIIIIIVWLYAFLTGFTPSVQRSAIMFTFIAIGKHSGREYNIYNVLAASALFQLLMNPFTIMEVGFQLSYLAVLGIVMFQKIFTNVWFIKNKALQHLWQITCVSVAAQLITFPIGLLYFYQFPTYFFVSNLLVIPVSFVIMIVGFALLVLYPIPYLGLYLGKLLNALIWLMNESVFITEKIPFSLIQGLSISIIESWLIYVLIFLAFAFIHLRNNKIIIAFLVILTSLFSWNTIENYSQYKQQQFVVYAVPKTYAYDFIAGKSNILFAPKTLTANYSQMQFHIMHNWWENDIRQHFNNPYYSRKFIKGKNFFQHENFIQFNDLRVAIIDNNFRKKTTPNKLKVDYIVLQNNPKISIQQLQLFFDDALIIADGSNKNYKLKYWQQEADSFTIPFHNINEKGAFVLNIK